MSFKYSNLNRRVITIFRISLFFKITKNKNHFAGVMKVTPLLLLFSYVKCENGGYLDSKIKKPFQLKIKNKYLLERILEYNDTIYVKGFMDNLNEYILRYQQYKKGNYKYQTITSPSDVHKLVENEKKIVFIRKNFESSAWFLLSVIFIIVGLIPGFIIDVFYWETFIILFGMTGVPCIIFLILGLWCMRTHYIVLGAEGIAYKFRNHKVRGYNWEEITIDLYNLSFTNPFGVMTTLKSFKIHTFMPNGDQINVEPENYSCKEISVNKYSLYKIVLFMLVFVIYYDYGKNGRFRSQARRLEDYILNLKSEEGAISSHKHIIDTWRDQLKDTLHNSKRKNYNYDKYWTSEQIQDEFLKKKIFVLKGNPLLWVVVILPLPFFFIPILGLIFNPELLNLFLEFLIIIFVLWLFSSCPIFLFLSKFIVISSSGIYYRNLIRKIILSWDDLSKIEGIIKEEFPTPTAFVIIFLHNGKKIKFTSKWYKNKEFLKKVYPEMFLNLFNSNFKLSKRSFDLSN